MKKKTKRILVILIAALLIVAIGCAIAYFGFYGKVYNQSNVPQNTEIGSNIDELTLDQIVTDLVNFSDRFAGTKANAEAGQYIRNYFVSAGLQPYSEEQGYYHSFHGEWLKNSDYYHLAVNGTVENVVGKIIGEDSSKAVIISAHFDSYMSKGVLDNATGVAVLLELSKRLAEQYPTGTYPVDIVFVSFNAEECGLKGSRPLYEEFSRKYEEFYNINMDVVGALDKPLAFNNLHKPSQSLYTDFLPILNQHDIPVDPEAIYAADIYNNPYGRSDHAVFQEQGKSAIILGESKLQGYTNTPNDSEIAAIDFPELLRLTDAVEQFIISTKGKIY
ncbi:MAG: M28 family metallopeptidase [Clostridiales bacterium]|nr:M28 family metallopeptidase [Clostridiales bacterium]